MSALHMGVEMLSAKPNLVAMAGIGTGDLLKIASGLVFFASGAMSAVKACPEVEEGYVGMRLFNGQAVDDDGNPIHPLLEPGRHWMLPFFHKVEMVNIQGQTVPISTRVDLGSATKTVQYDLEAVASWGVITQPGNNSPRPKIDFMDAYNFYYGIDTLPELAAKVDSVATKYLSECAEELREDNRTRAALDAHANQNLECIVALARYGVQIRDFDITNFSHTGVVRLTAPSPDPVV